MPPLSHLITVRLDHATLQRLDRAVRLLEQQKNPGRIDRRPRAGSRSSLIRHLIRAELYEFTRKLTSQLEDPDPCPDSVQNLLRNKTTPDIA